MEDFIVGLRIEEDNKRTEKKMENTYMAKANVVLHGQSSETKKKQSNKQSSKQKDKGFKQRHKGDVAKKLKFQFSRQVFQL